jgi:starch phosphorylase
VVAKVFPNRNISYITNGAHSTTWTTPEFQTLYDKYLPDWRRNNSLLKNAGVIPAEEIWSAHQQAKKRLLDYINKQAGLKWSENVFTVAYARRMASYKRPGLLFFDINRLLEIQAEEGKMQIIYAGKAHPQDEAGRKLIQDIYALKNKYVGRLEICFLENYEAPLAKLLIAGADLWLNTPLIGNEASGTSGMKAAHNGVPQLSTLDGWWEEGYVPGQTGWLIAGDKKNKGQTVNEADADSLYEALEKEILPAYYHNQAGWREIMRSVISLNAARFNTERVLGQYIVAAYGLE